MSKWVFRVYMFAPLWKLRIAPGGTGPFGGWSIILTGTALSLLLPTKFSWDGH